MTKDTKLILDKNTIPFHNKQPHNSSVNLFIGAFIGYTCQ